MAGTHIIDLEINRIYDERIAVAQGRTPGRREEHRNALRRMLPSQAKQTLLKKLAGGPHALCDVFKYTGATGIILILTDYAKKSPTSSAKR